MYSDQQSNSQERYRSQGSSAVGRVGSILGYNIVNRSSYQARKFGVSGTDCRIRLNGAIGRSYSKIAKQFDDVMDNIVDDILGDAAPHDQARISVSGDNLDRNLNIPYMRRDQVTGAWMTAIIGKMLQSHEDIDLDNGFSMSLQHVVIPNGAGRPHKVAVDMMENILTKRSVVTHIPYYPDIPCFGYAVFISQQLQNRSYGEVIASLQNKTVVVNAVEQLFRKAGVPLGDVNFGQYEQFQSVMDQQLVVVDSFAHNKLLFKGTQSTSKPVLLLLHECHYYALKSLTGWFGGIYYCIECEKKSDKKHTCKKQQICHLCEGVTCLRKEKKYTFCTKCKGIFKNIHCKINHSVNGICARAISCTDCGSWMKEGDPKHKCRLSRCVYCKKVMVENHTCYIEINKPDNNSSFRHIYYDFECTQNDICETTGAYLHKPNYCIAISSCDKCSDVPCADCNGIHVFSGLDGDCCLQQFGKWCFSPINRGATFIAHNAGNYDSHFILKYLIDNKEYPHVTTQGGKFLCIEVKTSKAKFIDSFSFLAMPLSKFSSTFGIKNLKKGAFPHLFNKSSNYNYNGLLPALKYYGVDSMKTDARNKLVEWHSEHSNDRFNFRNEIKQYCIDDVKLLKAGCEMFRDAFINDTGVDPFTTFTIAGACMKVYRTYHLKDNTIGRLPGEGLQFRRNYSHKAMQWLTWIECSPIFKLQHSHGFTLQHAWHGGEKRLEDAKAIADGFDSITNTVYNFAGCYFHGCPKCYKKYTWNTRLGKSMGDLDLDMHQWRSRVEHHGYTVITMYECVWGQMVKHNIEIQKHIEKIKVFEPITPRDALYGGRTEAFASFSGHGKIIR